MSTSDTKSLETSAAQPAFQPAESSTNDKAVRISTRSESAAPRARTITVHDSTVEKVVISFDPQQERERRANLIANEGQVSPSTDEEV